MNAKPNTSATLCDDLSHVRNTTGTTHPSDPTSERATQPSTIRGEAHVGEHRLPDVHSYLASCRGQSSCDSGRRCSWLDEVEPGVVEVEWWSSASSVS